MAVGEMLTVGSTEGAMLALRVKVVERVRVPEGQREGMGDTLRDLVGLFVREGEAELVGMQLPPRDMGHT